jgi:pilus assembly protein CpaE
MRRVLMVDMAIPFGDADMYLTQNKGIYDITDFVNAYERLDNILVESMTQRLGVNFHLIPSAKDFQKVLDMKSENFERTIERLKSFYDFTILDFSSNIDPVNLNIMKNCDHVCVVLSKNLTSVRLSTQKINILEENEVSPEKIYLIVNESEVNDDISKNDIEVALNKKINLLIPFDDKVIKESLMQSKPVIKINATCKFSKEINRFSHEWTGEAKEETKKRRWHDFF